MLHLNFCMLGAYYEGETKHHQKAMEVLGIKYSHSTPHNQWEIAGGSGIVT